MKKKKMNNERMRGKKRNKDTKKKRSEGKRVEGSHHLESALYASSMWILYRGTANILEVLRTDKGVKCPL